MTLEDIWESVDIILVFFIMLGAMLILGIVLAVRKALQDEKDLNSPVCSAYARIIQRDTPAANAVVSYVPVIFEFESGERKCFSIRDSEIHNYCVKDEGMLFWQGTRLLRFERGANPQTATNTSNFGIQKPQVAHTPASGINGSIPTWKRIQMEQEDS